MYDELFNKLRELKPAGADGFEGLIKALLEDFAPDLGISFLAKSGFQGGIDVSSAGRGATWAGLECKHYEKGSCPSARELVGGLAIAISNSREQLDLWLLATTGAVGAHEAKELHQASEQAGVTVEIVDWQEAGPPTLAVLCAASPIHSFAELSKRLAHIDRPKLDADFSAIAAHPGFSATKAQMRERLSASRVGMSRARKNANAWIEQSLQSKENSYARFKQYLCPHDRAFGVFAERAVVTSGLNTWYGGWQAKPTLGVVHGPEGIGKSWAAMGWWSQLADQPLTLIVTSNMTLPTCGPVEWLAKLLSERTGFSNDTFWQKALERWLRRPAGLQPLILLVFDGLNEQPREEWISRLVGFREQAVAPHVAVLVTCWTTFWNQQLEARVPDILGRTLIQVKPFTDAELTAVLAPEGLAIDKLRPEVREFLRIPRVCRAAMGHLTGLADSNDLTVARLLVTDWKYRLKHKQGLTHTDRQFNDTVIGLAREILAGVTDFSKARLRSLSSLAQASPDRNLGILRKLLLGGCLNKSATAKPIVCVPSKSAWPWACSWRKKCRTQLIAGFLPTMRLPRRSIHARAFLKSVTCYTARWPLLACGHITRRPGLKHCCLPGCVREIALTATMTTSLRISQTSRKRISTFQKRSGRTFRHIPMGVVRFPLRCCTTPNVRKYFNALQSE